MQDWIYPTAIAALGVVAVAAVGVALAGRARSRRELAVARAETAGLNERLAQLERSLDRADQAAATTQALIITSLGDREDGPVSGTVVVPRRIDGRLFADLVVRESVVKAAGWAHGVRRAWRPEARFRMRHAMRREVKRSRKSRRAELREARRYLREQRREDAA
jgi:hypothetical protein